MPRSAPTRGAAIPGWMACALFVLPVALPWAAAAQSPSLDPVATPPQFGRPAVAPAMSCEAAVRVAGQAARTGPYAELQARHNAIESWRGVVSARLGVDYTHWWRARDKDVACQDGINGWRCEAQAVPCMAQGGAAGGPAALTGLGMVERR